MFRLAISRERWSQVIMDFFEASSRLQGQPRLVDVRRFCEEVSWRQWEVPTFIISSGND